MTIESLIEDIRTAGGIHAGVKYDSSLRTYKATCTYKKTMTSAEGRGSSPEVALTNLLQSVEILKARDE